jgi:SCP-2 sterol transfer family
LATVDECEQALRTLADRLAGSDGSDARGKASGLNRRLACRLTDLETEFSGRLTDGKIIDLVREPDPDAQISLILASDDLIALTNGRLNFVSAWAGGRVKVNASIRDMLKLRALL